MKTHKDICRKCWKSDKKLGYEMRHRNFEDYWKWFIFCRENKFEYCRYCQYKLEHLVSEDENK